MSGSWGLGELHPSFAEGLMDRWPLSREPGCEQF